MCVHTSKHLTVFVCVCVCVCVSFSIQRRFQWLGWSKCTLVHNEDARWQPHNEHRFNSWMWQMHNHLPTSSSSHWSSLFRLFFFFLPTLLLRGTEKCFSFPPSSVELWWTNCEARVVYKGVGNKTRNNVEKWAPQLVSAKQLMLLAVGKSARGQNPSLVLLSRRV